MLLKLLLCILALAAFPTSAAELHLNGVNYAKIKSAITKVSHGQATLVRTFPGPDGLTGVVLNDPSGQHVAWVTTHGEAILAGNLLSPDGDDLTRMAMINQGLVLSPASVFWQSASPLRHAITVGTHGPLIVALFDPNCVFCHQLYRDLTHEVAAGHLRVRFVMVGTLKPTSIPRSASILAAANPAKALDTDESAFGMSNEEGGFPVAGTIDPAMKAAVISNNELFTHAGAVGTPAIYFCSHQDLQPKVLMGTPHDVKTFIADVTDCNRSAK